MRIVHLGDVVGRSGRELLVQRLPGLRQELGADVVVVNGENAAGGFGISPKICEDLYAAGTDVLTTGNHVWDQRELIGYIDGDPRLIRPLNMAHGTPGRGWTAVETPSGARVLVLQVLGRIHMKPADDPFRTVDSLLERFPMTGNLAIVVDVHAEITAEKQAMGHYVDGRATLVAGTHTHCPTADARVLPGGTAFVTDLGMCGSYDSVIGMDKHLSIRRFTSDLPGPRMEPATGPAELWGVVVDVDPGTGRARAIERVHVAG
ncbi:MAG: YmdB family metallophosphoesterase [Geminicoccaceae bacterium]|nr:MAG: YmdB family metallophosphoesterase [Geminicoccaceae bacterium]